jgi:hypothetical protein
MIDKLIIRIDDTDLINNTILPKLTAHKKFVSSQYASETHLGHFENFEVDKKGDHMRLRGSLAQYALRANCFNGDRRTIKTAIDMFCNETAIPKDTRRIYLEFGFNIPVEAKVSNYLRLMQYASGYPKRVFFKNDHVVFIQDEKKLRLYNKTQDFKANQYQVRLDDSKIIQMLRYEVCLTYPKRVLKLHNALTLADLYATDIYQQLINLWADEFKRIKVNSSVRNDYPFNNVKDMIKHLCVVGINQYGGLSDMLLSSESIEFADNKAQNKLRLKRYLERAAQDGSFNRKNSFMEEPDAKILSTAIVHKLR